MTASEYFFKKMLFLWYEINIKSSISWKFEVDEPRGYRNTRSASPWCLPLVGISLRLWKSTKLIFFWGLRALRLQNYKGEALGGGRSCISVTSRLIKIKFSGNATFYIYFISQISIFLKYIHIFQKYVLTYVGSAQKNGTTSVNHLIWRVFFAGCIYLTLFKDLKVFFFFCFFF